VSAPGRTGTDIKETQGRATLGKDALDEAFKARQSARWRRLGKKDKETGGENVLKNSAGAE